MNLRGIGELSVTVTDIGDQDDLSRTRSASFSAARERLVSATPPYGAGGFVHWQEQGVGNPGTGRNKAPACSSRAATRRGQRPRQRLRRRVRVAAGLCFERRLVAGRQLHKYIRRRQRQWRGIP